MNKFFVLTILLIGLVMTSCNTSNKLLKTKNDQYSKEINLLNIKNKDLVRKNKILLSEISSLKNTLKKSKDEIIPNIKSTTNIDAVVKSTSSQFLELENYFKNDQIISAKLRSFKKAGVERKLNISYYDMQKVILEAKKYMGTRHVMGGLSKSGIDCSGLLYVSFKANGITDFPRIAENIARYGNIILNTNDVQEGDLVFFTNTYGTSMLVTHVGICTGKGKFIHTSSSKGVMISHLNDPYYWRDKFLFGTRIIN